MSKVRSLVLDEIPLSTLSLLQRLGNARVNAVLEHSVDAASDYAKIDADSNSATTSATSGAERRAGQ